MVQAATGERLLWQRVSRQAAAVPVDNLFEQLVIGGGGIEPWFDQEGLFSLGAYRERRR
jgi:hypothetical protein